MGYNDRNDNGVGTYQIVIDNSLQENKEDIVLNNGAIAKLINDNSKVKYIFPNNWKDEEYGSGDCFVIQAFNKNLLIDSYSEEYWNEVRAFLDSNKISHIDYFFLTHYHADHMGNFVNLVVSGYIDSNTILYLPQTSQNMIDSQLYSKVHSCIEQNNFTYIIPNENDVLHLGMNVNLKFYNTEKSFIESQATEWNNCSMLILLEHGNTKTLLTGDAQSVALKRAKERGFLREKIDLYKINHHGVILTGDSSVEVMEVLKPIYAVQTAGQKQHKNRYQLNPELSYLKSIGTELYATYSSEDYIVFESTVNTMKNVSGKPITNISNGVFERNLYVDSNTTNTIQDGTEECPFSSLIQALSKVDKNANGCKYIIHLADGNYSTSKEMFDDKSLDISSFAGRGIKVKIIGNTQDKSAVKLYNGFSLHGAEIEMVNLTIYTDTSEAVFCEYSNVYINNCIITTSGEAKSNYVSLRCNDNSTITIVGSEISKSCEAIRNNASIITMSNTTIKDNTIAINNNYGVFNIANNVTFTNNETECSNNSGKINWNQVYEFTSADLKPGYSFVENFDNRLIKIGNYVHINAVINATRVFTNESEAPLNIPAKFKPAKDSKCLIGFGNNPYAIVHTDYGYITAGSGAVVVKNNADVGYRCCTINMSFYAKEEK